MTANHRFVVRAGQSVLSTTRCSNAAEIAYVIPHEVDVRKRDKMSQPETFDDEINYMAEVLSQLESKSARSRDWDDSPFKWILTQPSATKGSVGRQLAKALGTFHGLRLDQIVKDNQYYLEFGEVLIQVKFSTMWDTGVYRFQQIRDHDYDFCLALGLAPFHMNAWLIPKEILDTHVIGTQGQHTGATSSETWWFEVTPQNPQRWIAECGGQLSEVGHMLRSMP